MYGLKVKNARGLGFRVAFRVGFGVYVWECCIQVLCVCVFFFFFFGRGVCSALGS